MFTDGSRAFVLEGIHQGTIITLTSVDADAGTATADIDVFGRTMEQTVQLDDLLDLSGTAEQLRATILGTLEVAFRRGFTTHLAHWWAIMALEGAQPDEGLLDEFEAYDRDVRERADIQIADSLQQVRDQIGGMDASVLREWIDRHFAQLLNAWKIEADQARATFCEQRVDEPTLREATAQARAELGDDADEERVARIAQTMAVGEFIEAGLDLQERCEHLRIRNQTRGFAYDEVPVREVDLDTALLAEETPEPLTPEGLLGWSPTRDVTPPQPVPVSEALAVLDEASTSPVAALRALAEAATPRAIEALEARLADLRALDETEGWSNDRYYFEADIRVALLASDTESAWRDTLAHVVGQRSYAEGFETAGFVTASTLLEPFGDNPWGIDAECTLTSVLETVWGPLASRLPNFTKYLRQRCLAVAHVIQDGQSRLFYLMIRPRDHYLLERQEVPFAKPDDLDMARLHEWVGLADVYAVSGELPSHETHAPLGDDEFTIPLGLRELRCAHRQLTDGMRSIDRRFVALSAYCFHDIEVFQARNDGAVPRRFVTFSGDGVGNCDVFDLDQLDARQDPLVADWDHETREVSTRLPFWRLMDQRLCEMLHLRDW